jgi:hypothetical protein
MTGLRVICPFGKGARRRQNSEQQGCLRQAPKSDLNPGPVLDMARELRREARQGRAGQAQGREAREDGGGAKIEQAWKQTMSFVQKPSPDLRRRSPPGRDERDDEGDGS